MQFKAGSSRALLASLSIGDRRWWQGLIFQGRDILVFIDDPFEYLCILVPEQEIGAQLKIFGCVEGNKMDLL
jgi:hypothetical protein